MFPGVYVILIGMHFYRAGRFYDCLIFNSVCIFLNQIWICGKNYSSVSDMNIVDLARRGMCLHMGTVGLMFGHGLGGVNKM